MTCLKMLVQARERALDATRMTGSRISAVCGGRKTQSLLAKDFSNHPRKEKAQCPLACAFSLPDALS